MQCTHCNGTGFVSAGIAVLPGLGTKCEVCNGTGITGEDKNVMGELFDDNAPHVPVPPLATPIEGFMDKSFLERTAPRLRGSYDHPDNLLGATHGEKHRPAGPLVPVEGAVILEVVTRHRVAGPEGRDYGATVSVVTPGFGMEPEKCVAQMKTPGPQAGEIAIMLTDVIAAMAIENDLMQIKGQERSPLNEGHGFSVVSGFPVHPYPVGPLGEAFEPSAKTYADMMTEFASSSLDPMSTMTQALDIIFDRMPDGEKKENLRAKKDSLVEVVKKAFSEIQELLPDGPSIKDEAFDTQADPAYKSLYGKTFCYVNTHNGYMSRHAGFANRNGYQAHPLSLFGAHPEDPISWSWYQNQKQNNFVEVTDKLDKYNPDTENGVHDKALYIAALMKLRVEGEQPLQDGVTPPSEGNTGSV